MNIKATGKDRRMGDKAKVLVGVLDRSLFRDRDDICRDKGNRPSRKEVFMSSIMGGIKNSAFFPSGETAGPCALAGLIKHNFLKIESPDIGETSSLIVLLKDTETSPPPPLLKRMWVSVQKPPLGLRKLCWCSLQGHLQEIIT